MKGRSLKPDSPWDNTHPAFKKARPGSARRDRQRREGKRKARLRKRERGPGCAIGILMLGMMMWLKRLERRR